MPTQFTTLVRGALENCRGFVDGTVRPICRPGENQCIMYNGHKRVHAIKFQFVVAPNGLNYCKSLWSSRYVFMLTDLHVLRITYVPQYVTSQYIFIV